MLRLLLPISVLLLFFPVFVNAEKLSREYVGAEICGKCHAKQFEQWKTSGHARIISRGDDPAAGNIPAPPGYGRIDISYIIGGFRWKTLFLDDKGYLITSTPEGPGNNQYNVSGRRWVDHLSGERIRYDCGRCHTTGYLPGGRQRGIEGIVGTWQFEGVQCEACHGPGGKHARTKLKDDIVINTGVCVNCHGTEPLDEIPLRGVFLAEYTEANHLLKSPMGGFSCTVCHDPHVSSSASIRQSCESCHQEAALEYKGSYMELRGVKCIECHMPFAAVIAEGNPAIFRGDFRSHLFRVDHRKDFPSVEKDGLKLNPGYLSVDYACMPCHSGRDRDWAVRFGMFSHRITVTPNIKIMTLQSVLTYAGTIFALFALLTGLNLKNYFPAPVWLNKKKVLTLHRLMAWTTFSIFVVNVIFCLFFHFPLDDPLKALNYGWFLIHSVNGLIGMILYGGKIFVVRSMKEGWTSHGLWWGAAIFLFWLIQVGTVLFRARLG